MSRMLAAKASLAVRVDALGEESNTDLGIENKAKLEIKQRAMEEGFVSSFVLGTKFIPGLDFLICAWV